MLTAGLLLAMGKIVEKAGPAIRERCSEMCEGMLANMPETFPPNRMMANLEAITEQTARILEVLEESE
jgi:hypothetical protein